MEPSIFVIFGGAGDLTWRKLVPALFDLYMDGRMPSGFAILSVDAVAEGIGKLRQHYRDGVRKFSHHAPEGKKWNEFAARISYLRADFTEDETYAKISGRLDDFDSGREGKPVHIFYLATPPRFFGEIAEHLGGAGLARKREQARIVVEKPIGHDLASMLRLNRQITGSFHESQIFRIDHFLGKETVRNILVFRFANPLFEPIWDRRYVDYVTITVAESIGVEHRGAYYEHAGALRDMIQNHLMQLLCLVAMEPPLSFDSNEVRNKKVDVLHAVRPISPGQVDASAARGQYGRGIVEDREVPAYREEDGVAPDSSTETYASLKLMVDNWRWQGVPFYLRTGKRLAEEASEVSIHFKNVPHQAFPREASLNWLPAALVICIQPQEGIVLRFQAKLPGPEIVLEPVWMHFLYEEAFRTPPPDAYETLLWDVMLGDATIFMRSDQVEAAWSILTPVIEHWEATPPADFPNYAAGTWGPLNAEVLITMGGCAWPSPASLEAKRAREKP